MLKWTDRLIASLLLISCWTAAADADPARAHFERGVALSVQQRWEEAARAFEDSARELDRFATRFNLVILYDQLDRPIELLEHAQRSLTLSEGAGLEAARERVSALLEKAKARVARIDTHTLATDAQVRLDGVELQVHTEHSVYVLPGLHVLDLCAPGIACRTFSVSLAAGQTYTCPAADPPRAKHANVRPAIAPIALRSGRGVRAREESSSTWRTRTARTLGPAGGALELSAWVTYAMSVKRGRLLEAHDPYTEGVDAAATRYWKARNAVFPLALTGGSLMAVAVGLARHRAPSRAWSITSLAVGTVAALAGVVVLALPPPMLGTFDTEKPTRQAGALTLSMSFPLLSYGAVSWFAHRW